MICTDSVTTSGPNGLNPTDPASNDTMTTTNQTATERLTDLRDHEQASLTALCEAQIQHQRTHRELKDVYDVVRGYERSTRPAEMALRDEAQASLVRLQEQAKTESVRIATLEGELNAAKARIVALFEGQDGYGVAVAMSLIRIEHVVVPGCTLGHGLGPDVPVSYTRADFVTGQDPYVAALDMVW